MRNIRLLSVLLVISLIAGLIPENTAVVASAASEYLDVGQCGSNLTYVLDTNGVLSITGEGDMSSFADAASVPWFKYRSLITTVSFQGEITGIGAHAFEYCVNLASVKLPDALTGIGAYAFYQCAGLTGISIPNKVTSIGAGAFAGCSGLDTITIPDSVTSIGEGAFDNTGVDDTEIAYRRGQCGETMTWALLGGHRLYLSGTGAMTDFSADSAPWYNYYEDITEVVMENGVTHIGSHAFERCRVITEVLCPDSVVSIGSYAFAYCPGLKEITLKPNIKEISDHAFYHCDNLQKVTLLSDLDVMGSYLFAECGQLSDIDLPDTCAELGDYMFSGCTALDDRFVFPKELKRIGNYTFQKCICFTEMTVPDSVQEIGEGAFSGCYKLHRVVLPFAGRKAEAEAASAETLFGYIFGEKSYTDATLTRQSYSENESATYYIPDTLTEVVIRGGTIYSGTFDHCVKLEKISIPEGMTQIPAYLYRGCNALEGIAIPEGITSIGDYAYSGTALSHVSLSDQVRSLGKGAFSDCLSLEKADLPKGIEEIPDSVFSGCVKLSHIRIADGVQSIGDHAYEKCEAVTELKLPASLQSIGSEAFRDCTGIQTVAVPDQVVSIGKGAFSGCSHMTEIKIPFVGGKAGAGVASDNTLFGYIFGTSSYVGGIAVKQEYSDKDSVICYLPETLVDVTVTGGDFLYGAFSGCSGITKLSVPDRMKVLGPRAFSGCRGLEILRLPEGIGELGDYVLSGCARLTSIVIPDGVTRIGKEALGGCSGLKEVVIPAGVTEIGEYAFWDCEGILKLSLPDKLTTIGSYAFQNCRGLTEVEVPDAVTEIGAAAFSGCSSIGSMKLPFAGGSRSAVTPSVNSLFGYIFGAVKYDGSIAVKQKYASSGTKTYYLPSALRTVEITGGNLLHGAFSDCSSLTDITVPEGLTSIGNYVFSGCSGLTEWAIPDTVTSIGDYAFKDCTGLKRISLPDKLTTIGSYAFQNCTGPTDMQIPDTVTAIGAGALSGCSSLERIRLPFAGNSASLTTASTKTLFGYIFGTSSYQGGTKTQQYYSGSSSTYYIPSTLRSVEITGGNILYGTFYNCAGLTSITLPDQLTEVGKNAFYNCNGLTQITIPPQVSAILSNAFTNCTNMNGITFLGSAPSIDAAAFKKVTASVYYPNGDNSWIPCVGEQYGGTLTWAEHSHEYTESRVSPTCTEKGYTLHKCTGCESYYITDYIRELGHIVVTDPAVKATCTEKGLTEGAHCAVCATVIAEQKDVKALGHSFTDYISNQDATYDADGTKTAVCGNGCGEKDTIEDKGSRLSDQNKPEITITMGAHTWRGLLDSITFNLIYKDTQSVTIQAADEEVLPDGSSVSRLDQVYYYIASEAVAEKELAHVQWREYNKALPLTSGARYLVYAKAVDKSGNISYASTDGILIDSYPPMISGVRDGSVYCGRAEFTVSDLSPYSVTDNGEKLTPASDGSYVIMGDGMEHRITAVDDCGNRESVRIRIYKTHTWEESQEAGPLFIWGEKNKSCQAQFICEHEADHSQTMDCMVTVHSGDADCTTVGQITYLASVTLDGRKWTSERTISGAALGHEYATIFHWTEDFVACEVDLICQRPGCTESTQGHRIQGGSCVVEKKVTRADCIREGRVDTIASIVIDGSRYTDTGKTEVTAPDPDHHVNTQVLHACEPTCGQEGYTGDLYCDDCKKVVREGTVLERLQHEWDRGVVTKEETATEDGIRTYTCMKCGAQKNETIAAAGKGDDPVKPDIPEKPDTTDLVQSGAPVIGAVVRDKKSRICYKVTKSGTSGGTVTCMKTEAGRRSVFIPDKVMIGPRSYKVTAIADRAFKGNKELSKVTIGRNIKKIGRKAFYGCKKLKKVTIRTTRLTAGNIGKKAFAKINSKAVCKVPSKKMRLYKKLLGRRGILGKHQRIRK